MMTDGNCPRARHIRAMHGQPSLFPADDAVYPGVSGLAVAPAVVPAERHPALTAAIDAAAPEPFRFGPWTGHRRTRSFGWHYDFAHGGLGEAEAMPGWLVEVRAAMAQAFGLAAEAFVQALVIRYDPGAGIGWHRDRPVFGKVMGLSLGAPAALRLRRRTGTGFERASLPLVAGEAYLLDGAARHAWEHSIVPMAETRWSITFRTLAQGGLA